MILPDKLYDALKWCVIVAIPIITTFYVTLDSIFGWGYGDVVAKVSSATCAMIGGLLGISSVTYYQKTPLEMPENETVVDNHIDDREG